MSLMQCYSLYTLGNPISSPTGCLLCLFFICFLVNFYFLYCRAGTSHCLARIFQWCACVFLSVRGSVLSFFCTFLWSLLAPFLLFLSSPLANTTHGGRTDDTFAGLHLAYEVKKLMYAFYFLLTTTSISIFSQFSCFRSISLTFFFIQLIKIVLLCKSRNMRLFFHFLLFYYLFLFFNGYYYSKVIWISRLFRGYLYLQMPVIYHCCFCTTRGYIKQQLHKVTRKWNRHPKRAFKNTFSS